MGTRSIVTFYDENDAAFCTVYRQMDGYPSYRGKLLAAFLKRKTIVDGFTSNMSGETYANGMGDLAAQWIATRRGDGGLCYAWQDWEHLCRSCKGRDRGRMGGVRLFDKT